MGLFGIGDGKIEITLTNVDVSPGDKLEGAATLTLNQDVKAKVLIATLYSTKKEEYRGANGQPMSRTITLYKNEQQLDGAKTYLKSSSPLQYKFSFVIPQTGTTVPGSNNQTVTAIEGALGAMNMGGINMGTSGPVRWFVSATLEIPWALGISKSQEINIVSKAAGMS